jgi:hypothetical protein
MHDLSAKTKSQLTGWISVNIGQPMYDERTNLIWIFLKGKYPNVGDVSGIIGVIPTENGAIQVTGSSMTGDFEKNLTIFQNVIMSIKVNQALAYK